MSAHDDPFRRYTRRLEILHKVPTWAVSIGSRRRDISSCSATGGVALGFAARYGCVMTWAAPIACIRAGAEIEAIRVYWSLRSPTRACTERKAAFVRPTKIRMLSRVLKAPASASVGQSTAAMADEKKRGAADPHETVRAPQHVSAP